MAFITLPFPTFVNRTVIDASQVNANNAAILAQVNGSLDNTNISTGAAIAVSKLGLSPGGAAFNKTTTGGQTWASGLTTDTQAQIAMTSDAGLQFGPGGSTAPDVALIRSAANTLKLQVPGGGTPTLNLTSATLTALASIGLLNTFTATITPAVMAANRAIQLPDPGGSAKLFCGDATLANHQLVKFDGSIFQGIAPGTAGNRLVSNGTDFVSQAVYQSSDQTITSAGALTLAHGLARVPSAVWIALVNVNAEGNYTIGQVVYASGQVAAANGGVSIITDATNLTVRFGSGANVFKLPDATTGADTALTNANWHVRFFAS